LGMSSGKHPKIIVMATLLKNVQELNAGRSDPTIRGFDQEPLQNSSRSKESTTTNTNVWEHPQDKQYKFCRFQACTWQQFGHRVDDPSKKSTTKTPHAFAAMALLEKLACDPGVVAIMVERQLVVGTLGEMDPIDDRLKQKMEEEHGGCLLGYNTNGGARIDLKLRPDSMEGFLPYSQIVSTLIHELSHNWVGDHNALFWSNFAQMRVEYIHKHVSLATSGHFVRGKSTLEIADLPKASSLVDMRSIADFVIAECSAEMKNYGIPVEVVTPLILDRCRELTRGSHQSEQGRKLGSSSNSGNSASSTTATTTSTRELALAAAERRLRQQQKHPKETNNGDKNT